MIEVVSLQASHIAELKDAGALKYLSDYVTPEKLIAMEQLPYAFSALGPDGKVLACAGVIEIWAGRAEAWAFLSLEIGNHFLAVHRTVARFLKLTNIRRIEAVVDADFAPGHRWIKMLGFQKEAERMRKYNVNGSDSALYSLIKETT